LPALVHILSYIRPYSGRAALVLASLVVDVILNTLLALSLKFLIDFAIVPHNRVLLVTILCGLIAGFVIVAVAQIGRDYLYSWLGAHVLNDLRKDLLAHFQILSLGFFARSKLGDLLARFSTDLSAVENAIVLGIPATLFALLNVIASTFVLFILEWHLAALVLVGLPLCLIGPRILGPRALEAGYGFRIEQAALASTIQENLSAQPVIKAFNLRDLTRRALEDQASRVTALASHFNFLSAVTERSPNIGMLAFGILVIAGGGTMAFYDAMSVGSLVSFNVLFVTVSAYVESLTAAVPTLLQAAGGMRRIREILEEEPTIVEAPDARSLPRLASSIALEHVSFGYLEGERNLNNVTLEIPRGAKVAFVGPSGSGKSTIVNLIMRFYDPQVGRVLFDGVDLRTAKLETVYGQTGIVFQESFLFNTSIRENIRLGHAGAVDTDVEAAARAAELDSAIAALPQGYDTVVGERGGRLSGGQRQRVAIARALIGNPAVIVLDEATSALDPAAAAAINETIGRITADRTVISITHRLQDVTKYNRIFVLSDGTLIEQGTHEELMRANGTYASLWRRQSGLSLSDNGEIGSISGESLREVPLFSTLDKAHLEEIAHEFITEHVPAGRTVIVQGDQGSKFFIIVRGKVGVTISNHDGGTRRVAVLTEGDYFGEMSLIARAPTNASVETLTPSIFITLQRDQFNRLIRTNPGLNVQLEQAYRKRQAETSKDEFQQDQSGPAPNSGSDD